MKNALLFITPVLIWGSTWYVIKFQVGNVDAMLSVSYRFGIAGVLMLIVCSLWKMKMDFTRKEHQFILLQGLLIFGFNYWLVYTSELYLTSGLVGLIFSLLVFLNILNGRIFLKTPFENKVIIGGFLGLVGTGMVFWKDLSHFSFTDGKIIGLCFAVGGTYLASLGNITSARNQKAGIPVIQSNAFGMVYGAIAMFVIAVILGKEIRFEVSQSYVLSLLYLAIFGSIIAFGAFMTLIGNIGASKAAYVSLVAPVIALTISTFLEDYTWTTISLSGAVMILVGNVVALRSSKKKEKAFPRVQELEVPVEVLEEKLPDKLTK
ncbi:MAG: EamA family transporter [Balneola sp.]|nr:EamA family transporter [Balneola sp.]MBO6651225.1 EamA family transporter [Balneola sp.]MBO6712020.1 EamA family transporter [Balneola sp.]MBO6800214.1 EamA family transporter [Balneola sp.]MBO6869772.1 EamA family transporter [Balneola sp.]